MDERTASVFPRTDTHTHIRSTRAHTFIHIFFGHRHEAFKKDTKLSVSNYINGIGTDYRAYDVSYMYV